jgi:hypothetical protein
LVLHESLSILLLDENVFQNPQIFRKTLRFFPEQSTLVCTPILCSLVPVVVQSCASCAVLCSLMQSCAVLCFLCNLVQSCAVLFSHVQSCAVLYNLRSLVMRQTGHLMRPSGFFTLNPPIVRRGGSHLRGCLKYINDDVQPKNHSAMFNCARQMQC